MSRVILIAIFASAILATGSILFLYPYEPKQPPRADDSGSTLAGLKEVVNANNQFALKLYYELAKNEGNIFYSPYSILSALLITYEGAKNDTAEEMRAVLSLPDKEIIRPNFALLYNKINENDYARTGNALWVQKDFLLFEEYKRNVERYYGGKASNLDFSDEKSMEIINRFIEEQTNGKIKDFIREIDPSTRLIITNAIYFKGIWKYEFNKSCTYEEDFKIDDRNAVRVQMMHLESDKFFKYAETDELQILELPYKGEKFSMLILLPKKDGLDLNKLEEWKSMMKETLIDEICLPKFEIETSYTLNENLKSLGIISAFQPGKADFSGITSEEIWIGTVIHKAYICVDEEGSEAAAASAVIMPTSAPSKIVFKADHPFILVLQERDTGNILFMGKIVNPAK